MVAICYYLLDLFICGKMMIEDKKLKFVNLKRERKKIKITMNKLIYILTVDYNNKWKKRIHVEWWMRFKSVIDHVSFLISCTKEINLIKT